MSRQICFAKDEYMYCNAIRRAGKLQFRKNGGYYRFELKKLKSKKQVLEVPANA